MTPTRPPIRHVAVVGLMGSGKSTIGRRLAASLGWPMRDSDVEIEAARGRTVRQLRDELGVDGLHEIEAGQLLAALAAEPGHPVLTTPQVSADSPRLQDVLADDTAFEVTVHEGFDFWVEGQDLEGEAADSLERANATVVPTTRMAALPSAYWVRIGERTHIRLVLPDDEDPATDALARLHSAGDDGLGGDTRLLGAFRACGLLVPVWDLDPELSADDYEGELAAWGERYAAALANDTPLDADQRRARSGLLSRQVTLR
jgi:hypothetical protein